jgi:hypothetical protein
MLFLLLYLPCNETEDKYNMVVAYNSYGAVMSLLCLYQ